MCVAVNFPLLKVGVRKFIEMVAKLGICKAEGV